MVDFPIRKASRTAVRGRCVGHGDRSCPTQCAGPGLRAGVDVHGQDIFHVRVANQASLVGQSASKAAARIPGSRMESRARAGRTSPGPVAEGPTPGAQRLSRFASAAGATLPGTVAADADPPARPDVPIGTHCLKGSFGQPESAGAGPADSGRRPARTGLQAVSRVCAWQSRSPMPRQTIQCAFPPCCIVTNHWFNEVRLPCSESG